MAWLVDENVADKFDWCVPLWSGYTLHQNTSIAYRYAPDFAFVHRGQTRDIGDNNDTRWDDAPPGVNLIDIQALVMTTMSGCPRGHQEKCNQSSWIGDKNVTHVPPVMIDCIGFTCTGLSDE